MSWSTLLFMSNMAIPFDGESSATLSLFGIMF
jgi:hypothetical protein